jgi:hypothetical protein
VLSDDHMLIRALPVALMAFEIFTPNSRGSQPTGCSALRGQSVRCLCPSRSSEGRKARERSASFQNRDNTHEATPRSRLRRSRAFRSGPRLGCARYIT